MDIRGGPLKRGASNKPVSSKIAIFASFGRYVFRNFKYETKVIMSEYVVPQSLLIDIETDDLIPSLRYKCSFPSKIV